MSFYQKCPKLNLVGEKRKKSKRQTDNRRIEGMAYKNHIQLSDSGCLPMASPKEMERGHNAQDLGILLVQPMVISNESFMVFVGLEEIKLPWWQNFQSPNEKIWRKG